MKIATVDDVMSWSPGMQYTRDIIKTLFNGKRALSATEILALDIPIEDRFWAVLRLFFFTEQNLRFMAAAFAESVCLIYRRNYPIDIKIPDAIKAARLYALNEITENEMIMAGNAVMATARAAAGTAYWEAKDAARDARAAAKAARNAARAAAWDAKNAAKATVLAANDAARSAGAFESKKQIDIINLYLAI